MATKTTHHKRTTRNSSSGNMAAVRRLMSALDRLIVAAKQAEKAREELARRAEGERVE